MNVPGVMANWTGKLGYPVVDVVHQNDKLVVKQSKFNLDGKNLSSDENDKTQWMVPITFKSGALMILFPAQIEQFLKHKYDDPFVKSENETKKIVLDTESTEIDFAQATWINANYNSAGFYVTKLSDELLEKVLQNLDQLSVADRLKIVYDQLQLAKSGLGSTAAFFDMLLKFKCENNF